MLHGHARRAQAESLLVDHGRSAGKRRGRRRVGSAFDQSCCATELGLALSLLVMNQPAHRAHSATAHARGCWARAGGCTAGRKNKTNKGRSQFRYGACVLGLVDGLGGEIRASEVVA